MMPAEVPGVVHLDLLNNNVIEDPFYRMNESKVQWIGKENGSTNVILKLGKACLINHKLNYSVMV